MNYKYIVKRPFKYGGKEYEQGDDWTPVSKVPDRDKRIIESDKFVLLVEVEDAPKKTTRRRRSKANG